MTSHPDFHIITWFFPLEFPVASVYTNNLCYLYNTTTVLRIQMSSNNHTIVAMDLILAKRFKTILFFCSSIVNDYFQNFFRTRRKRYQNRKQVYAVIQIFISLLLRFQSTLIVEHGIQCYTRGHSKRWFIHCEQWCCRISAV